MLLLIILLVLVFGGGGYYGYSRWGADGPGEASRQRGLWVSGPGGQKEATVRFLVFGFVVVMFAGCAGTGPIQPSVSNADLLQLATEYQAALSRDEELSRLSSNFSISDSGAIRGTLEVNKKAWADLSQVQRDQIIKRATDLYARQFTTSRASILGVSNVTIKDDMGSTRGWILVCTCGKEEYSLYGSW